MTFVDDGQDDDLPTAEEADESHQNTLYDHACLIVDEEMSGETRQRFFAHLRSKYNITPAPPDTVTEDFSDTLADRMRRGESAGAPEDPYEIPPMLQRV